MANVLHEALKISVKDGQDMMKFAYTIKEITEQLSDFRTAYEKMDGQVELSKVGWQRLIDLIEELETAVKEIEI